VNGDEVGTARSEIESAYERCAEAIAARDVVAFFAAFDPRSTRVRAESQVEPFLGPETQAYFVWRFGRMVANHEFTLVIDDFELAGARATVEFTEDNEATVLDTDDRPVRRRAHVRERGVWVRTPEGWVQVEGRFLETPEVTVDGTPVTPEGDPVGGAAYEAARTRA
jgi:hypothetical protein